MKVRVESYRELVGDDVVEDIYDAARKARGLHIAHINSTYQGGGVAELLNSIILLMNDLDIKTGWRILHGDLDFFSITKKFHNCLQGGRINLSKRKKIIYEGVNENFSAFTHLDHDCVIVHDPQPLPMIVNYERKQPWVWRCHIDISRLNSDGVSLFNYLKTFLLHYDSMIVSMEEYKKDIPINQRVIRPSIDPLSQKNVELKDSVKSKYLKKFGIPEDKPIITQVSRFDYLKDPLGVIEVFKRVRQKVDCRLVLIGSTASDDPEGANIHHRIISEHGMDDDICIISASNDILVNSLQSLSSVVLQKSLREGFALTVSEALWKRTPVVASNVGGIPSQIMDGENGFLVNPKDYQGCADRIVRILDDQKLAKRMGERGRQMVEDNFLVTRHVKDYINLVSSLTGK